MRHPDPSGIAEVWGGSDEVPSAGRLRRGWPWPAPPPAVVQAQAAAVSPPSAEEAKAFVDGAEKDLMAMGEYAARMAWVQATYITDDTNWLNAKVDAEANALAVKYAKQAARFDRTQVDPVTRRKLKLLKAGLVLPASDRPGAARNWPTSRRGCGPCTPPAR